MIRGDELCRDSNPARRFPVGDPEDVDYVLNKH